MRRAINHTVIMLIELYFVYTKNYSSFTDFNSFLLIQQKILIHTNEHIPIQITRAAGGTNMKLMTCAGIQNIQLVLYVGKNFCLHSSNKSFLPFIRLKTVKYFCIMIFIKFSNRWYLKQLNLPTKKKT